MDSGKLTEEQRFYLWKRKVVELTGNIATEELRLEMVKEYLKKVIGKLEQDFNNLYHERAKINPVLAANIKYKTDGMVIHLKVKAYKEDFAWIDAFHLSVQLRYLCNNKNQIV